MIYFFPSQERVLTTEKRWCGSMAEQLICNQQVDGSTPFTSSNQKSKELSFRNRGRRSGRPPAPSAPFLQNPVGQSMTRSCLEDCFQIPGSVRFIRGEVPEWPKGADCKSVVFDFDGSNPSSSTKNRQAPLEACRFLLLPYSLFTLP